MLTSYGTHKLKKKIFCPKGFLIVEFIYLTVIFEDIWKLVKI